MNARTGNTKLFHHLVNNERKCSNGTSEPEVKDKMYYGPDQIAYGFREHFLQYAVLRSCTGRDIAHRSCYFCWELTILGNVL
jgi:hypothetical protein